MTLSEGVVDPYRYGLILTHNRPEPLRQCVEALSPQVDSILVIDNASNPPAEIQMRMGDTPIAIMRNDMQPPNLAKLWNIGLNYIEKMMHGIGIMQWDVAILCDDVLVQPAWFDSISHTMRSIGAVAGCTHAFHPVPSPILKVNPDGDIMNRMQGSAFIVVGEKGQRADESMQWWWCDTDMDWQARLSGGMIVAPGPVATNTRPNDFTVTVPGLAEQAGRDGEAFAAKWGGRPW
jgi:glycosyltransferase involved in cell wall biosynthesis